MQTYSHLIVSAALNRGLKNQEAANVTTDGTPVGATDWLPPTHSFAFLFGSLAPDLPLILLTVAFIASDMAAGNALDPGSETVTSNTQYLFDTLFFSNPWVKSAHNLFHAPILVIVYTLLGYWLWKRGKGRGKRWGIPLFWFGLSCAIHTAIDIPVHYDDGPLLLFPFNLEARFYSPLSYWDPARGGIWFTIFEHLLVLGLLGWLVFDWLRRRSKRKDQRSIAAKSGAHLESPATDL